MGFQCSSRKPQAAGYFFRGHCSFRIVAAVQAAARPDKGPLLLVDSNPDPAHAVRKTSCQEGQEVGRDSKRRRVPSAQRTGRRRVGNVGGVFLCGSAGASATSAIAPYGGTGFSLCDSYQTTRPPI